VTSSREGCPEARARAEGYWFLAGFFANAPSAAFLQNIVAGYSGSQEDDSDRVVQLHGKLRNLILGELVDALVQRLAPESIRLFGGLHPGYGPPPPYESAYVGGQSMGDVTLSVLDAFEDAGMGSLDTSHGPCDHICSELKFMAALCVKEDEAWTSNGAEAAAVWLERQRAFLQVHILNWLPGWRSQVAAATEEPYFQLAVELALAACQADAEIVRKRIELSSY
jgi:TorA maturation chaperone TorD